MLIFIFGEDTYRSRQKLREIIEKYKDVHKNGLDLKCYNRESFSTEDINNVVRQTSMFQEKKLIILRDIFAVKDNKEKPPVFLKNLKSAEDIVVIYEDGGVEKGNALFRFLKKYGKCQEFSFLEKKDLREWIKKEFGKYNAEISFEAENKLLDFVGNDLWRLSNEINKVANFKAANSVKKTKINAEEVGLLVKNNVETDIFETIDAIARKDKGLAFSLLHKHLEKGDSSFYLLSMINFQFRNLLIVKDLTEKDTPYYSIAQKSKLHPFVVKKSYEQAGTFSFQELKKIYQKILEADLNIKTGKVGQEAGLDILIGEV